MRGILTTTLGALVILAPVTAASQAPVVSAPPVVTIDGPTVIMFSTIPDSVQDPDRRQAVYAALDQQQGQLADSRAELNALGAVDVIQLGRRFVVRDPTGDRLFEASPDSAVIGLLLAAPGRESTVLYRVQFMDSLIEAVRAFLDGGG